MILRAVSSLAPVVILTLILAAARTALALKHLNMPPESGRLCVLLTQLFVACWVYLDQKDRRLSLPFDFEAFVLFVWPLALPYYLYKSRGARRGILLTLFIFALVLFQNLIGLVSARSD